MNIYIGNLSREATEDDIKEVFKAYGEVVSVTIIKDKFSGEPRGFAFVDMPSKTAGQTAITELNGKELKGQTINVNEARPRTGDRGGSGRGGGGRNRNRSGGGGGGGGGFRNW